MVFYIYTNKWSGLADFKNIWKNTYLGKLLTRDPIMGRILSVILVAYLCIHVFRLETYPLYMFAMFSKQETPRELYHTYSFYNKHQRIQLDDWDYRKYTVFMNTMSQYDGILNNNMTHPEADIIDKFVDRLHLGNTSIKSKLKGSFFFFKEELEPKVVDWISAELGIKPQDLRIEKENYYWTNPSPKLNSKFQFYAVD